ncbi:hypothetical protein [Lysinibacillus sp. NPDC056232]|uniref:hypothetical protein n=1 Tax=Lysinibacillus sp. NPDC056232 TaxID=3345756 RepID=UPI0035D9E91E
MRKRSGSYKCFICAKAKRQRQSAQSERKSTPRYGDEPIISKGIILFSKIQCLQCKFEYTKTAPRIVSLCATIQGAVR